MFGRHIKLSQECNKETLRRRKSLHQLSSRISGLSQALIQMHIYLIHMWYKRFCNSSCTEFQTCLLGLFILILFSFPLFMFIFFSFLKGGGGGLTTQTLFHKICCQSKILEVYDKSTDIQSQVRILVAYINQSNLSLIPTFMKQGPGCTLLYSQAHRASLTQISSNYIYSPSRSRFIFYFIVFLHHL